jgi:uncharacterized protein (TIGR02284 family)
MRKDLEILLERNIEGYRGYTLAAEDIQHGEFKSFLKSYATTKKKFMKEIEEKMEEHGLEPVEDTSFLGDLHRAFMKIRESMSSNRDRTILEECSRGESMALSDYEKALKTNSFPEDVLKVLINQRDHVLAAERTMRNLALQMDEFGKG